jgi:two-component system CheB/CheR fusion protein
MLDQALIQRHAPASVLIESRHRVHYFRGPSEDYLGPPSGEPTHNLLAIARPGVNGGEKMPRHGGAKMHQGA